MAAGPSTQRSREVNQSLPSQQRHEPQDNHLLPLLDSLPETLSTDILDSAPQIQPRPARAPISDLHFDARAEEIKAIWAAYATAPTGTATNDGSKLLLQCFHSVARWLGDMWWVAHDRWTGFDAEEAQKSLVYVVRTIAAMDCELGRARQVLQLRATVLPRQLRMGNANRNLCRVDVDGIRGLCRLTLWVWRDVLLTILTYRSEQEKSRIQDMLKEMVNVCGWAVLEDVRTAGLDHWARLASDAVEAGASAESTQNGRVVWHYQGQSISSPSPSQCAQVPYWTPTMRSSLPKLGEAITAQAVSLFKLRPERELYEMILRVARKPLDALRARLHQVLVNRAYSSPDAFAVALDVFIMAQQEKQLLSLLECGAHLLRPRDAATHQRAVATLGQHPVLRARALAMVENELLGLVRRMYAHLLAEFPGLATADGVDQIHEIMNPAVSDPARQRRLAEWLRGVRGSMAMPGSQPPRMPVSETVSTVTTPSVVSTLHAPPSEYTSSPEPVVSHAKREPANTEDGKRWNEWLICGSAILGFSETRQEVIRKTKELMPFLQDRETVARMIYWFVFGRLVRCVRR
ncbi:hypothetical protein DENSPDRAFT_845779 [Dentipellis sp. KUC8613]|nr:hypothetical protein DENSPDRAFT_845779 [Dentipellis sp. KUC8613]